MAKIIDIFLIIQIKDIEIYGSSVANVLPYYQGRDTNNVATIDERILLLFQARLLATWN
ncbi:MAG: hypothetical protein MJE68_20370 [Proteobacteria bacterium]|nr:hypothetical protein [Pseudomonadota bacterium]